MQEIGLVKLTKKEAALRLARIRANEILDGKADPLRHVRDFEHLWIDSGYPSELSLLGNLYDDVYLASGSQSDDMIRDWITDRLREFLKGNNQAR